MESRPHRSKSGYLHEMQDGVESWNGLVTPLDIIKPTRLKTDMELYMFSCVEHSYGNSTNSLETEYFKISFRVWGKFAC